MLLFYLFIYFFLSALDPNTLLQIDVFKLCTNVKRIEFVKLLFTHFKKRFQDRISSTKIKVLERSICIVPICVPSFGT